MASPQPFDRNPSLLTVGHAQIDRQHAEIFSRAAVVSDLINRAAGPDEILGAFLEVLARVDSHFAYEEELMARVQYPHLERHRVDHNQLKKEGAQLLETLGGGDPDLKRFYEWWRGWSVVHVLGEDEKLGAFLSGPQ